jgi:hypothetical protein
MPPKKYDGHSTEAVNTLPLQSRTPGRPIKRYILRRSLCNSLTGICSNILFILFYYQDFLGQKLIKYLRRVDFGSPYYDYLTILKMLLLIELIPSLFQVISMHEKKTHFRSPSYASDEASLDPSHV